MEVDDDHNSTTAAGNDDEMVELDDDYPTNSNVNAYANTLAKPIRTPSNLRKNFDYRKSVALSKECIDLLVSIGCRSDYTFALQSNSSISSRMSHLKLLKHNNISFNPNTIKHQNINKILDSMVTYRGEPLNDNYKNNIASTIRALFGKDVKINTREYNRKRKQKKSRATDAELMREVCKLAIRMAEYVSNIDIIKRITNLTEYDTALAALLCITTDFRISTVLLLTMNNIFEILNSKDVVVHDKGAVMTKDLHKPVPLSYVFIELARKIFAQRQYVVEAVEMNDHTQRQKRLENLVNNRVILSSASVVSKKIHEMINQQNLFQPYSENATLPELLEKNKQSRGFNIFRKFTSSVLIMNGEHTLAKILKHHTNMQVTEMYNHSNMDTYERSYDKISSDSRDLLETSGTLARSEYISMRIQRDLMVEMLDKLNTDVDQNLIEKLKNYETLVQVNRKNFKFSKIFIITLATELLIRVLNNPRLANKANDPIIKNLNILCDQLTSYIQKRPYKPSDHRAMMKLTQNEQSALMRKIFNTFLSTIGDLGIDTSLLNDFEDYVTRLEFINQNEEEEANKEQAKHTKNLEKARKERKTTSMQHISTDSEMVSESDIDTATTSTTNTATTTTDMVQQLTQIPKSQDIDKLKSKLSKRLMKHSSIALSPPPTPMSDTKTSSNI